jgi:hypothetical protein
MICFKLSRLGRRFRETQKEWYAQVGTSWHITCFEVLRCKDGIWVIDTEVHIAIIDGDAKQEAAVNVALMKESLKVYNRHHPEIEQAYFRSDNAG